jgi:DHA2 family multidrug resistance protein
MIMLFIHDPHYLKKLKQKVDYWGLGLIVVGIGSLQIVLDKGQREDWFSSAFITRLAIISAISLIAFILIELKTREPILNLREFKDVSFSSANIIQCVAFFVLFGILVMLPLFLQQLLGYTAVLAGMVLAPGGIASLIAMPIAGRLLTKVNPKILMIFGIIVTTISTFIMVHFNLYVDFALVAWSRFIMGIGLSFIFVSLASTAFATIKKEEMGNATSIFNLLRNISGSFGIAFMTTVLARRGQFHQFRLIENLTPSNPHYQASVYKAMDLIRFHQGASDIYSANGLIYKNLMKQTTLFSFTDCFFLGTIILICIIPLVFLLKKNKNAISSAAAH